MLVKLIKGGQRLSLIHLPKPTLHHNSLLQRTKEVAVVVDIVVDMVVPIRWFIKVKASRVGGIHNDEMAQTVNVPRGDALSSRGVRGAVAGRSKGKARKR